MRLSDAIRLGSLLHPQHFGGMRNRDRQNQIIGTCALGAAIEAGFGFATAGLWLNAVSADCPACRQFCNSLPVFNVITHLNDDHRWTREQIADWVGTVEVSAVVEELVAV